MAQAVSWARAEQTHFWHPGEQIAPRGQEPHFDPALIGRLVDKITAHEAAWQVWFTHRGLLPHEIAYGVPRPRASPRRHHGVSDRRQADDLNVDWIARFRG